MRRKRDTPAQRWRREIKAEQPKIGKRGTVWRRPMPASEGLVSKAAGGTRRISTTESSKNVTYAQCCRSYLIIMQFVCCKYLTDFNLNVNLLLDALLYSFKFVCYRKPSYLTVPFSFSIDREFSGLLGGPVRPWERRLLSMILTFSFPLT